MNLPMVTGVILAGGKNSRMGTDKGLLMVQGERIVERIIKAIKPAVDEIIIISNGTNYDYLGYKIYSDLIKDSGPMGGIYTALSLSDTKKNFVVSCDMPFISMELVNFIIKNAADCQIAIPKHDDRLEPICAVYDKSCVEQFSVLLKAKDLKLHDSLSYFKVKQIHVPENIFDATCFENINTPAEYETLKLKKDASSN